MSPLLLTFYGDDFTGSTDALEQLTLAGLRTVLFIRPPSAAELRPYPGLQAAGVAGLTRSLRPAAMEAALRPALGQLKALGARHVHYKICSTFDSSPAVGNLGRVLDVAAEIFPAPFIPVLAAAPALGRYTVFGNHFARYGIGSAGAIHRLDRHPAISRHPITPMTEADLRQHLAAQTRKRVALFDILQLSQPARAARAAFARLLTEQPEVVLFDALEAAHLTQIGGILDAYASRRQPLFSVGSSGIEAALAAHCHPKRASRRTANRPPQRAARVLVGSGSCSPVTAGQIAWALRNGFAEVALRPASLASQRTAAGEIERAATAASRLLAGGRSVIVHTTRTGADPRLSARLQHGTGEILGTALGQTLREILATGKADRVCLAGGDTSSFAARALGITALEMIAPLTPGAPLCCAAAAGSPVNGAEVVFKGGQVGPEDYFAMVQRGHL
jgi:uncharacterized protein YgbK (DUF1537 family)